MFKGKQPRPIEPDLVSLELGAIYIISYKPDIEPNDYLKEQECRRFAFYLMTAAPDGKNSGSGVLLSFGRTPTKLPGNAEKHVAPLFDPAAEFFTQFPCGFNFDSEVILTAVDLDGHTFNPHCVTKVGYLPSALERKYDSAAGQDISIKEVLPFIQTVEMEEQAKVHAFDSNLDWFKSAIIELADCGYVNFNNEADVNDFVDFIEDKSVAPLQRENFKLVDCSHVCATTTKKGAITSFKAAAERHKAKTDGSVTKRWSDFYKDPFRYHYFVDEQ